MFSSNLSFESATKAKGIADITVSVSPVDSSGRNNNFNPLKKGTIGLLPIGAVDRNNPTRIRAITVSGARHEKINNGRSVTSWAVDKNCGMKRNRKVEMKQAIC